MLSFLLQVVLANYYKLYSYELWKNIVEIHKSSTESWRIAK